MGRGDKKTKKGKINMGSYGVSRKRADNKKVTATVSAVEAPKKATTKKTKTTKKVVE